MADKFKELLKEQEILIRGKVVEKYPKPTCKTYEEIKEENQQLRQVKKFKTTLLLHSLMPHDLRKSQQQKTKATMGLHTIDVDRKVKETLN